MHICVRILHSYYKTCIVDFVIAVSPEALVTVTPPIMVLANQSDSVTLSCSSEGGPGNTFQWSHDGTDLQGETDPVLQLSNLTATDGGRYTCTVTNPASKGRNSTNVIGWSCTKL